MTRIKYILKDELLVSVQSFSTREHEELVYAEINPRTFSCNLIATDGSRGNCRSNLGAVTSSLYGSSLSDCKKKIKVMLKNSGVSFDVEIRNKKTNRPTE